MRRDNLVRDAGVAGSNPATPTILSNTYTFDDFSAQRIAQRNGSVGANAVPVEFAFAYERWGKAVHALVTANDRFVQIAPSVPEKSVLGRR